MLGNEKKAVHGHEGVVIGQCNYLLTGIESLLDVGNTCIPFSSIGASSFFFSNQLTGMSRWLLNFGTLLGLGIYGMSSLWSDYCSHGFPACSKLPSCFMPKSSGSKLNRLDITRIFWSWMIGACQWATGMNFLLFSVIIAQTVLFLVLAQMMHRLKQTGDAKGFGAFMLFFLAATTNTIVVSLLMSLAVVGGFMVFFFTCLTAIYVGALSIAAFVISAATLVTVSAVVIAAGWIGFFWLVWQGIRKSLNVTRSSFLMTASALAAISTKGSTRNPNHRKIY
eukprot:Gb_18552 [translate_table: standard]